MCSIAAGNPAKSAMVATLDTIGRRHIDLNNPLSNDIDINDIANGLSLIPQFNGQILRFYSLAQHSVLVSSLCPPDLKLEGLLHASTKAYFGDVTKPLKTLLGAHYRGIEMRFEEVLFSRFGLCLSKLGEVKAFDHMAFVLEDQALRQNQATAFEEMLNKTGMIVAATEVYWRPVVAKMEFLRHFNQLTTRRA